jgi:hypothetical protein
MIEYKRTSPDNDHMATLREKIPLVNSLIRNPEDPKSNAAKGMPNKSAMQTEIILRVSSLKYAESISPDVVNLKRLPSIHCLLRRTTPEIATAIAKNEVFAN